MSRNIRVEQVTRVACATPRRETCIIPTLLPVCCVCGLIRDDTRCSPDREIWVTQRTYHEAHGVNLAEIALTHTYCPNCFTQFHDAVRQDFRKIGTRS